MTSTSGEASSNASRSSAGIAVGFCAGDASEVNGVSSCVHFDLPLGMFVKQSDRPCLISRSPLKAHIDLVVGAFKIDLEWARDAAFTSRTCRMVLLPTRRPPKGGEEQAISCPSKTGIKCASVRAARGALIFEISNPGNGLQLSTHGLGKASERSHALHRRSVDGRIGNGVETAWYPLGAGETSATSELGRSPTWTGRQRRSQAMSPRPGPPSRSNCATFRERVTGVKPATLCLASVLTPVTIPSLTI